MYIGYELHHREINFVKTLQMFSSEGKQLQENTFLKKGGFFQAAALAKGKTGFLSNGWNLFQVDNLMDSLSDLPKQQKHLYI